MAYELGHVTIFVDSVKKLYTTAKSQSAASLYVVHGQ